MLFASSFRITADASVDLQLVRFLAGSRRKRLSELRGHCSCVGLSTAYPHNYRRGGQPKPRCLKSLAAIDSMLRMAIVHRPDVALALHKQEEVARNRQAVAGRWDFVTVQSLSAPCLAIARVSPPNWGHRISSFI